MDGQKEAPSSDGAGGGGVVGANAEWPPAVAVDRGDVRSPGPHANAGGAVERSSNTQLLSSQSGLNGDSSPFIPPQSSSSETSSSSSALPDGLQVTTAIDWLSTAGRVTWDSGSEREFARLDEIQREARERKFPEPYTLAKCPLLVHGNGMGAGARARLSYRLTWAGVTIGLADREAPRRNLNNFQLQVPGSPSLLIGALEARKQVMAMVDELQGYLEDEWVRRIDLCIDVAGLDLREELLPAFLEGRFITTAETWNPWGGKMGPTGFTIGSTKRVKLNVYDKLLESGLKQPEIYRRAMIDRRWNGTVPEHATRIEFQISKPWLDAYSFRDAQSVLDGIPDILHKLTGEGGRSFIRFTADAIDRENKHQSRARTLPVWEGIIQEAQRQFGQPQCVLKPIQRGSMRHNRAFAVIRGLLTQFAAVKGEYCGSLEDGLDQLRKLNEANFGTDEDWERTWKNKAREAGTLNSVMEFPIKDEVPF